MIAPNTIVAVTVALPTAMPVATPLEGSMTTFVVSLEAKDAEYVAGMGPYASSGVAVIFTVPPTCTIGDGGTRETES
ncbi:MAG: hypothetical protein JJD97_11945 [Gemmatimonadaceae bacterium]|nr:hypothetical protein [Gemmatimonadaceae bacterium]